MMVIRGCGVEEMGGDGGPRVQTFSDKMNKFWRAHVKYDDYSHQVN